jgi:hypothetical protein
MMLHGLVGITCDGMSSSGKEIRSLFLMKNAKKACPKLLEVTISFFLQSDHGGMPATHISIVFAHNSSMNLATKTNKRKEHLAHYSSLLYQQIYVPIVGSEH